MIFEGKIKGGMLIVVNEKILVEKDRKHGFHLSPLLLRIIRVSVLKQVQKQKRESGENEVSVSVSPLYIAKSDNSSTLFLLIFLDPLTLT